MNRHQAKAMRPNLKVPGIMDTSTFYKPQGIIITLWVIREMGPLTVDQLYQRLFGESLPSNSQTRFLGHLFRNIQQLVENGLAEVSGIEENALLTTAPIDLTHLLGEITLRVSSRLSEIQTIFNISLAELIKGTDNSIKTKPLFGLPLPKSSTDWPQIFVTMPLTKNLDAVYTDHILEVGNRLSLTCKRGDDFFSSRSIISEIWSAIYHSRIGIADCTNRDPNVFYELGIAHSIGKPCILITQSIEDIPIDVRHLRTIQYKYTPRGMKIFEEQLEQTLISELGLETHIDKSNVSILFLAADPTDASRLRLSEEMREIQEKLQLGSERKRITFHQRMAVRPQDVSQALLDIKPQIVHFSGHGTRTGKLCFEDQAGKTHTIEPSALAELFKLVAVEVNCVLLNACYSKEQAIAIAKHIDYVIGMDRAVSDKAAIAFTVGFYQALGAGRSIEEAYRFGCVQIGLQDIPERLTPKLIKKVFMII